MVRRTVATKLSSSFMITWFTHYVDCHQKRNQKISNLFAFCLEKIEVASKVLFSLHLVSSAVQPQTWNKKCEKHVTTLVYRKE